MSEPSTTGHPRLLRALGPATATAIVVGTVIGAGIFKKPQSIAENIPYFGLVAAAWIAGGILTILGALAYAEIAVLYPRAGGNYVFLREGFGRLAGFLWGWVEFWMIRAGSLAALATIFSGALNNLLSASPVPSWFGMESGSKLFSFWAECGLTVMLILGLAVVNSLGVRWGGWLQLAITSVKVLSLLTIMALPFLAWTWLTEDDAVRTISWTNLEPIWPEDWSMVDWRVLLGGLGSGFLAILWVYHGWMNITPVAEEIRNPQRNLPLSLLAGVGIVIFLYLGTSLAYYTAIPGKEMAQAKDPSMVAAVFCERLLGPAGTMAASAAVMFSVFGALNGNLLVGPRLLYAMGEDGLAPKSLGAVHPRFHTPARAIMVVAVWACLLVLSAAYVTEFRPLAFRMGDDLIDWNPKPGKRLFDVLSDYAMFGAVIFETMAVATIFVFRRREPNAERPYRCWGYPFVPILYLVLPALVLGNMFLEQKTEAAVGVGFIALGAVVYMLFLRGGREREMNDAKK